MDRNRMRRYWDERAEEDAFYFVDNRLDYGSPDEARFWEGGAEDLRRFAELVDLVIAASDDVVEIGCGVGRLTRELAARAASVRAFDVSERMIELARSHNPGLGNVEWIVGDGTSLRPVGDASADLCFSHVVFQHVPEPAITLGYVREMGRVLRPGGSAAFQISNAPSLHRRKALSARARDRLRALVGRGPRGQDDPAWVGSAVSLADLRATAAEAGLRIEKIVGEGTQFCLVRAVRG